MENNFEEQVEEIKKVFHIQQQYRFVLKQTSAKERIVKLKRLMEVILENSEDIQEAIYKDFRKPHEETLLTEILPVISSIKHTMRKLQKRLHGAR